MAGRVGAGPDPGPCFRRGCRSSRRGAGSLAAGVPAAAHPNARPPAHPVGGKPPESFRSATGGPACWHPGASGLPSMAAADPPQRLRPGSPQHQTDPGHAGLVVTAGPPTAWITWPAGVAVPGHQRALPGTWVCSPWTVDAAFRPRWVRRILDVRRWFGSCGWRGADHTRRKRGAASCVTSLEGASGQSPHA
jgi:hypothetical protein